MSMYRNPKLLKWAKGQPCLMQVRGVCDGGGETAVWAHSNHQRHGKGTGLKAHDLFGVIACASCHAWYDNGPASRNEKDVEFMRAWERTMIRACSEGVLHG